jgi:2,3-bisphosphoglycerate-independent phosphoglycerate mutase
MFTEKDGVQTPLTSHTLSPVPFAIFDSAADSKWEMAVPEGAGLSNVAATLMNLLGFEAPDDYDPSLITTTSALGFADAAP